MSHTEKVGFIPGNRDKFDKTLHIWPSKRTFPFKDAFCSVNYKPTVGEIHLQDYPSNIHADVWNKETGVEFVNQSLVYKLIENTKVNYSLWTYSKPDNLLQESVLLSDEANYQTDEFEICMNA